MVETTQGLRSGSSFLGAIGRPRRVAGWKSKLESRGDNNWSTHGAHGLSWHASHALMRLYRTVLHLHISLSSTPLGPEYEFPGSKSGMTNATKLQWDGTNCSKGARTDRHCYTPPRGTLLSSRDFVGVSWTTMKTQARCERQVGVSQYRTSACLHKGKPTQPRVEQFGALSCARAASELTRTR